MRLLQKRACQPGVAHAAVALLIGLAGIATAWAAGQGDKPGDAVLKADALKDAAKAEASSATKSKAGKLSDAPPMGSAAERETTAIAFAREHHPELVELIERLRDNYPVEYQRAIRELARTSDRLDNLKQKAPERYALELEAWKLKSHIQLLSARASMSPNEELTGELRTALEQQLDVRRRQLELDRTELSERLERTEATLEALNNDSQRQIDKQMESLLRGIDDTRARTTRQRSATSSKGESPATKTKKREAGKSKPK